MTKYRIVKVESYKASPYYRIERPLPNVICDLPVSTWGNLYEYEQYGSVQHVHDTLGQAEAELKALAERRAASKIIVMKEYEV